MVDKTISKPPMCKINFQFNLDTNVLDNTRDKPDTTERQEVLVN